MQKSVKNVAFPPEHGSWGLTFEPLTLALIVAYSTQGLILFLGAALAFLAHQPVRVLLIKKADEPLAFKFFLIYSLPAVFLLTVFLTSNELKTSLPLIFALTLMFLYLVAEYFKLHRALLTELMASLAVGLIALSMVFAAGWNWSMGWPFLLLLYLRNLNTTLYVHFRLKLDRNQQPSFFWPQVWQWLTLILAVILQVRQAIPLPAFLSVVVLSFRGIYGLSPWRNKMTVKQIGLAEFVFGLQFVVLSALGYLNF